MIGFYWQRKFKVLSEEDPDCAEPFSDVIVRSLVSTSNAIILRYAWLYQP